MYSKYNLIPSALALASLHWWRWLGHPWLPTNMEEEGNELSMDCQLDTSCEKGNIQATAAFLRSHSCRAPLEGNLHWQVLLFFSLTLTIPAGLPVLSAKEVSDEGGSLRTW